MVENSQMNSIDYIPAILDKGADYVSLPGVALLKDIFSGGIKAWSAYDKKVGVNRLVNYFGTLFDADEFIETVARKLTLAQETEIKALAIQKAGALRKMARSIVKVKNALTANDIDTKIKERAADDAKKIMKAIMEGKLAPHPNVEDIPALISEVLKLTLTDSSVLSTNFVSNTIETNQSSIVFNNQSTEINIQHRESHSLTVSSSATLSPSSEQLLMDKIDQLTNALKLHQNEAGELRNKITELENAKSQKTQTTRDRELKEALKGIKKIEALFGDTQILLPQPGQDLSSLTKQIYLQEKQMSLLTEEMFRIKDELGLRSPPNTQTVEQQETGKKIREELYKDW